MEVFRNFLGLTMDDYDTKRWFSEDGYFCIPISSDLLNPNTRGGEIMIKTVKPDAIKQLKEYRDLYFIEKASSAQQAKSELVEYLIWFDSEDIDKIIVDSELEPFQWWAIYGKLQGCTTCLSSSNIVAESERPWSVFNNLATERQNRLENFTVEK